MQHSPLSHSSEQNGFSLVEMAVVISIIALLVGSIITGKNMIRASEVQATTARVQEYKAAVSNFTERYLELPGDFSKASTYWTGARDGNGNGQIEGGIYTCANGGNYYEQWASFEHLSKAGLVEGNYTHNNGDQRYANPGGNTPATPIQGGGYTMRFCGEISTGNSYYFLGNYGHVIQIGSPLSYNGGTSEGGSRGPLFTTEEAGAVDKKMDDSYPGRGSIRAPQNGDNKSPGCTTTNSASTADYNYAEGGLKCPLFFVLGF